MVPKMEVGVWSFSLLFEVFFGIGFSKVPRAPQGSKMNDFGSQNGAPKLPKWWPKPSSRHRKFNTSDLRLNGEFEFCRVIPKKIYDKKVLRRCSAQRAQFITELRQRHLKVHHTRREKHQRCCGGSWECFEDPGPSKMELSCRRGAIFKKFMFFWQDLVLDWFLMIVGSFRSHFGERFGIKNASQNR